jgi:2-polyprenyl-6-methoxyphenol hydroxylase-like FAD-dependent oxidoreductase
MTAATMPPMIGAMASSSPQLFDVVVIGAGPAGVVTALRAARLGVTTALITRDRDGRRDARRATRAGPVLVPHYANALGRAAAVAAIELDHTGMWAVEHLVTPDEAGVT